MATRDGVKKDYTFIIWGRVETESEQEHRVIGVYEGPELGCIIREIVRDDMDGLAKYLLENTEIRISHSDLIRTIGCARLAYSPHGDTTSQWADNPVDARELLAFQKAYQTLELKRSQQPSPSQ